MNIITIVSVVVGFFIGCYLPTIVRSRPIRRLFRLPTKKQLVKAMKYLGWELSEFGVWIRDVIFSRYQVVDEVVASYVGSGKPVFQCMIEINRLCYDEPKTMRTEVFWPLKEEDNV